VRALNVVVAVMQGRVRESLPLESPLFYARIESRTKFRVVRRFFRYESGVCCRSSSEFCANPTIMCAMSAERAEDRRRSNSRSRMPCSRWRVRSFSRQIQFRLKLFCSAAISGLLSNEYPFCHLA
jgi:hypothetical protein